MTTTADEFNIKKFERNNYFQGKLMTTRDMIVEQSYHRDRLNTLAKTVLGEGTICGLNVSIESSNNKVTVTVSEGIAIDCCGN